MAGRTTAIDGGRSVHPHLLFDDRLDVSPHRRNGNAAMHLRCARGEMTAVVSPTMMVAGDVAVPGAIVATRHDLDDACHAIQTGGRENTDALAAVEGAERGQRIAAAPLTQALKARRGVDGERQRLTATALELDPAGVAEGGVVMDLDNGALNAGGARPTRGQGTIRGGENRGGKRQRTTDSQQAVEGRHGSSF